MPQIGRFQVLQELGRGGEGVVYSAMDSVIGRKVALKALLAGEGTEYQLRHAHLKHEAQKAGRLSHPNIVTVHELIEEEQTAYLVMEFVEGKTLAVEMASGAPMSEATILGYLRQAADALDYAHAEGVIHRDIKPANLMITNRGQLKIADFGIAKTLGETAMSQTAPGFVRGTPQYMAPEQIEQTGVSGLSDQFSLAVVAYEWLTGKKAFTGDTWAGIFFQILHAEPPAPERDGRPLGAAVGEVLRRGMAKKAVDRYPTCGQFVGALDRALSGTPAEAVPAPKTQEGTKAASEEAEPDRIFARLGRRWAWLAAAVAVMAALVLWFSLHTSKLRSLAVLPFANPGAEDLRYLSDGLTDNVINNLSRLPSLKIISRAAVYALRERQPLPQQIGQRLGVDAILTGTVSRNDDSLSVSVELSDVRSNVRLWGEQYTTTLDAVASVPEEIAKSLGSLVHAAPADQRMAAKPYTSNSQAYQLYLQGRFEWNKRTRDGLSLAIDFFEQAIRKDPKFALAYAGLADCYTLQGGLFPPREVFPKAKAAALRALDLDDDLAEAHTSLGMIKSHYDWEWSEAEHEFQRAIRLNRNYATGHSQYARLLNATGRFNEALQQIRAAQELDPVSLGIGTGLGLAQYLARNYAQAALQFQKTLALEPNFANARSDLGAVYLQQHRLADSISEYEAAVNIQPNDAGVLCELGQAYALAERRDDARKTLDRVLQMAQQRYVSAPFVAYIYIGLDDRDKAFEMLQKGFDERAWPLMFLKVEPKYDAIRQDRRFADLTRRLGL